MSTVSTRGRQPGRSAPATRQLVERQAQLQLIADLAERARAGTGSVLRLTGAAGTGRSALLGEAARQEAARGSTVLWARCSADESATAHAAARQLFETGPHPYRAQTAPAAASRGPDTEAALWSLLRLHTAHSPLLLAIDDIQFADEPSRRWLLQVGRRIDRLPVLLLVTERRQRGLGAVPARFGHGLSPELAETCRLEPLGTPAAVRLAGHRLGPAAPPGLAADCVRATGGNPLLLGALLDDLGEHPGGPGLPALPASCAGLPGGAFPEAVEEWLRGGGDRAVTAARALARLQEHPAAQAPRQPATGHCDPASMLAELAGTDPEQITGWLAELTAQGLLDTPGPGHWPRFAHPLLAHAVLAGSGPDHRATVHLAAADFLHRNGEPDELVAGHLLFTPAPAPRWAVDALRRAARSAARADRPAEAVALLRRVLAEPLGERRRGLVLTELGRLEVTLGRAERTAGVRHLAEAVHLQQSDEGVFHTANTLGAALAARGDTPAALEVMEELAERFAGHEDLVHAVQGAAALIAAHDGQSWLQVVEGLRRIAVRSPHRLAPPAYALLTEFDSTSGVLSAAEVAERVRELADCRLDPLGRSYVLVSAATLAQWADLLPEAERLVERGMAAYPSSSLEPGYQCLLSVHAELLVMRGEYQALLDEFALTAPVPPAGQGGGGGHPGGNAGGRAGGLADGEPSWWHGDPADTGPAPVRCAGLFGKENAHLVAQAVIALTETGRLWQAHGLARAAGEDRVCGSWEWNEFLYARGLLHLASGAPADALADLLECGRRQDERQVWSPIVTPWRSAAADCHTLLGEPGPAVALAEEELRLARVWGTPRTVGRALRALAAATGGRHGLDLAAESVGLLRGAEVETELIPALITHGRLLGESGRRGAARRTLREAAGRAERLGAQRLRGVALEFLRASGARIARGGQAGTEALTDSELRICRLAAAGHSNAEIAGILHVAVRTVETHLTNSFRKLGVRRRAELAGALEG
ncbi:AAA family ATPase [Kitasatospora sp. NPDC092286]|uniref:helix-turn-helix transcriptional regulator n=1 Tax=Kitasatospora sp. NPDC092286 TaxID=3364087 RepID=UPI003826B624